MTKLNTCSQTWACRWAPSLGELERTHQDIWGTKDYVYEEDKDKPTVFFGLYDTRCYYALFKHKGERHILWAGGDLENLKNKFAFSDGKLKWLSEMFKGLPNILIETLRKSENYVENSYEYEVLKKETGIEAKIIPSYLGRVEEWPISYKHCDRPNVYTYGHAGREKEYGYEFVESIAKRVPECLFHLYGAEWSSDVENVVCHGVGSKEQFNEEIKGYQCGLRPNTHDGFSEILAKSVLMCQWPISRIKYPFIDSYETDGQLIKLLKELKNKEKPNYGGRTFLLSVLNNYPWNKTYANNPLR